MEGSGESTLRAKYLDWCSARLAERFLDLSPEEIYALARPEAPDRAESTEGVGVEPAAGPATPLPDAAPPTDPTPATGPTPTTDPESPAGEEPTAEGPTADASATGLPHPEDEGYRTLVQRVTEVLLRRTSLPTFEQWAEAYAESPERFDAELLGFWKDAVDEEGAGGEP